MGPKKIKRSLYAGQGIPANATDEQVREVLMDLTKTLLEKLDTPYKWFASCFVAVQAGTWGGERRKKSREKLLVLINQCRENLGMTIWNPEEGWSRSNLTYGFGAIHQESRETGRSIENIILQDAIDRKWKI